MTTNIRLLLLIGIVCAIASSPWWGIHSQETGLSIISFPENTGKVSQVEALLQAEFGDQVTHWIEEVVVVHPDGEKIETYHYFEHPTDNDMNAVITALITEQSAP